MNRPAETSERGCRIEALTVILAVGTTLGWRGALTAFDSQKQAMRARLRLNRSGTSIPNMVAHDNITNR